jgi:hypothetical protein
MNTDKKGKQGTRPSRLRLDSVTGQRPALLPDGHLRLSAFICG